MTRNFFVIAFAAGLCLASISQGTPAPGLKVKRRTGEALLEVKTAPGMRAVDQDLIRKTVLDNFWFALHSWVLKPTTQLPAFKGPYSVPERIQWMSENLKLAYVEDSGILRISCRAGSPEQEEVFVKAAAEICLAADQHDRELKKANIDSFTRIVAGIAQTESDPRRLKMKTDLEAAVRKLRKQLADLPEIKTLDLPRVESLCGAKLRRFFGPARWRIALTPHFYCFQSL